MTTLQITPNWKNKTAKFKGTIAAGEHVAVRIINDDGAGDEFIQAGALTNLRLRVVNPANGKTLAQFPEPVAEGETPDAWDPTRITPLECELNLNTVQMLKSVPPAANVSLLFVLDAYKEAVDGAEGEFTLYFKDMCEVTHWPRRVGEDEPTNLDDYKDIIADFREDIYGDGGFKDRVEYAENAAESAAQSARLAAERAGDSESGAEAAASAAQASATDAANAETAAETAQGKAEEAQSAANTAKENAIAAQSAAETAQCKAETAQAAAETAARNAASAAASAVAEVAGDLADEVTRATGAESALDTAIKAEKTRATSAEAGLASDLAGAFKAAAYDSTARKIVFTKQDGTTASIDATEFIKDGMISSVVISGGNLVITFNSDAGKQPISIPLTQIFNPSNYYDKTAADGRFVQIEPGKGLSTNDYTAEEQYKLAGIESGAKNNVLEYANLAAFPATGEANKIYVAKDTNNTYRWETNAYVRIGGGGSGGTTDYNDLSNKPAIDGVMLTNTSTAETLGLATGEEVGELAEEVLAKYTKPQGGIPATDLVAVIQNIVNSFYAVDNIPTSLNFSNNGEGVVFGLSVGSGAIIGVIRNHSPRVILIPYANGTLALTSDIPYHLVSAGFAARLPTGVTVWQGDSEIGGSEAIEYDDSITGFSLGDLLVEWNIDGAFRRVESEEVVFKNASGDVIEPPDISPYWVLNDRACNRIPLTSAQTSVELVFPDNTETPTRLRDFEVRLEVASGATAPQITLPQGVVCENRAGAMPDIGGSGKNTLLYFSETAANTFLLKGEVVKVVA